MNRQKEIERLKKRMKRGRLIKRILSKRGLQEIPDLSERFTFKLMRPKLLKISDGMGSKDTKPMRNYQKTGD